MLGLLLTLAAADPLPLDSRIRDVTLYAQTALVRRGATLPGNGTFVVRGLPHAIDRDNVRLKCEGGDIANVEVRERLQEQVPSERVQALRARIEGLERELLVLQDEKRVGESMRTYLDGLMKLEAAQHRSDLQSGKSATESWNASFQFLQAKLGETTSALREVGWSIDAKQRQIQDAQLELGRHQDAGPVRLHDVVFEAVARAGASLEIEYFADRTGWRPTYELRAAADLSGVDMTYRAQIWQRTGEDWSDVELALSTAQPQRGAQGPEAHPVWVSIQEPPPAESLRAPAARVSVERKSADKRDRALAGLGYVEGEAADAADAAVPRPFAEVQDQGLSVRFQLAERWTIESRDLPTTVLIGSDELEITPERFCVPALDTTVWLRGKTKNTSAWTMLPGEAAVFLGADYLGKAQIETVQPGQELVLHLGADPQIGVERTQTEDLRKGPGFLSSRESQIASWRLHFENHGAATTRPDGAVEVFVREALPKATDERITVELSRADPRPSNDERWKQDMEEKGIQTWVLRVPRGGQVDLTWQVTVLHPKGTELVYR